MLCSSKFATIRTISPAAFDALEKLNRVIIERVGLVERKVSNAAVQEIFGLPELVEKILGHLDMVD